MNVVAGSVRNEFNVDGSRVKWSLMITENFQNAWDYCNAIFIPSIK